LGDQAYTKKLITVPQAEKLLGKAKLPLIADAIRKPPGSPTLTLSSDKRPSIGICTDDFDCFEGED